MVYKIYVITNKINGKQYVGVTQQKNIRTRIYAHKCWFSALCEDLNKYDYNGFTVKMLYQEHDREKAYEKESYFIRTLETAEPNGYNRHYRGAKHPGQGGAGLENTNARTTPILQYDLNGDFVAYHRSIKSASETTGAPRGSIHRIFKGKQKTAGGFIWKLNEGEVPFPIRR